LHDGTAHKTVQVFVSCMATQLTKLCNALLRIMKTAHVFNYALIKKYERSDALTAAAIGLPSSRIIIV